MKTITVCIGNSDNKLTQEEWSRATDAVLGAIQMHSEQIHFAGHSLPNSKYQNAAWVFEANARGIKAIQFLLIQWKELFKQDAIAWLEGKTQFI